MPCINFSMIFRDCLSTPSFGLPFFCLSSDDCQSRIRLVGTLPHPPENFCLAGLLPHFPESFDLAGPLPHPLAPFELAGLLSHLLSLSAFLGCCPVLKVHVMTFSSPKLPSTLDALDEVFGFHVVTHAAEALAVLCYAQPASSSCILSASPHVHLVQVLSTEAAL